MYLFAFAFYPPAYWNIQGTAQLGFRLSIRQTRYWSIVSVFLAAQFLPSLFPAHKTLFSLFSILCGWVMARQTDGAFSDGGFDHSFFAETARKGSVVSRANSIGSTSASSVPNTDDEDSDYRQETSYKNSYKDRRRQAHTQAEQKRRDAIKKGYEDLQSIVPTCQQQSEFAVGAQKISKATVLQKTIDYIHFLHKEKKKQEEEVSLLRKEVMALKIMKTNYEHIVKAHQNNPQQGEDQVSDQVKFNIFQSIMDSLFQSFSNSVSVSSFQELSACVFSWIEEHCKPQTLREFVVGVLQQLNGQLY
ncbi:max-like protein X isoform X1 [Xyrichtys novacula]|uniref:Max-like protein X n=2 Tax=Xyrichtys novacula TaxID=13765 RepID=A0AAV1GRL0_XYRNO|nr:max-like protein X isoform X1 [Xyrichtys novacula]